LPRPEDVEDSVQALGAIMGGVMRVTVPVLDADARATIVALADEAVAAVDARDAAAHLDAGSRLYDALRERGPNGVLVSIARTALVPLVFRIRASLDARVPNWELLETTWGKVRRGLATGDNVLAELAFEEMHRLPLPDMAWDPAEWSAGESAGRGD